MNQMIAFEARHSSLFTSNVDTNTIKGGPPTHTPQQHSHQRHTIIMPARAFEEKGAMPFPFL